jgi:hypothetical protein
MNNLCTLLNSLTANIISEEVRGGRCTLFSKNNIAPQKLEDLSNLIATVVRDDLGTDSKSLITNWAENNDEYLDFSFALRPDWLVGTPDDKQVKMRISIDLGEGSWYAHMIMDCEDGEIEAWGEKEFKSAELEEYSMPVKSMLEVIHGQYDKKFQEENAKSDADLDKATQVAKQLQKHVDAIKKLCKENKLNIYSDHSIDGTSCLYLVPDGMRCLDDDDDDNSGETIDLEKIPYLDFDACGFDPNYDFFHKVK